MKTAEAKDLLSRKKTAKRLDVCVRMVDYLRAKGELPCIKIGNNTKFQEEDIQAFIQRNRIAPQDNTELIKQIGLQLIPIGVAAVATALLSSR